MASPAQVIAALLVAEGLVTRPSQNLDWPVQVGTEPKQPDNTVTIYDTGEDQDSRSMNGNRTSWPTIQIRIRSEDYPTGWDKGIAIQELLDSVANASAAVGTDIWHIQTVHVISALVPIGRQEENLRYLFVINAALNLQNVED